ncbi:cytidylate kinase-like family protein [Desulforhopalus singaporensis]|uniref:Cytidylate kinase n=1 Tax=Desulforhopalus singaporensis TaxID=91360 RepID=A0A1H0L7V5_9BACT|nr:cytidylate kinase-like family protein [Desulforhopalus singaporensis]SDO64339.1 Cytidylate kinase [Desulforhopalus singaporensis]
MAIITISRGSYSRGKEVAEALADRLGYACTSRDILLETCEEFSTPEIRLVKALHDAPSILDRFSHGRERYISYFQSAFFKYMEKDNIVYHGLSGHFFLQGIAHAMKVRIIANMEDRIREEMKRENSSAEEARYLLKKDDDERRRWGLSLYGKDNWDSSLYDLVLHIDTLDVTNVVDILEGVVKSGRFDATPESTAMLKERALLANIHAVIVNYSPKATVRIKDGVVSVGNVEGSLRHDKDLREKTAKRLINKYGIKDLVYTRPLKPKKDHINPFHNIDLR